MDINFKSSSPRYNTIRKYLEYLFGQKVHKITLNINCGCPNFDGTLSYKGCIFCNQKSYSPSIKNTGLHLDEQIHKEVNRIQKRHKNITKYIAYLQAGTNTYIECIKFKYILDNILKNNSIVGISIGTRPDFISNDILDILEYYASKILLILEIGLQSIHLKSLKWMRRNHDYKCFLNTYKKIKQRKHIKVSTHIILGLPTETSQDMHNTATELANLEIDLVKLHNLYVAKDTDLAQEFIQGKIQLSTFEEHINNVVDFIERLHPQCIIDRVSSDAPKELIIAPHWCLDRQANQRAIDK